MAVDYIIASVLIISAIINVLALGAFWVTPSLRTTANRFVINLLIVNLVGCAVLIPSLFVCGNTTDTIVGSSKSSIVGKIITENVTIENRVECMNRTDGSNCSSWIIENERKIVIQEFDERFDDSDDMDGNKFVRRQRTRCWGFDLATALGESDFLYLLILGFSAYVCAWKMYLFLHAALQFVFCLFMLTLLYDLSTTCSLSVITILNQLTPTCSAVYATHVYVKIQNYTA